MKSFKYIFAFCVGLLLISCSEKWPLYNSPDNRLGFDYDRDQYGKIEDSIKRFTFAYHPEDIMEDTVWIDVRTLGFITDYDREFEIIQVPVKIEDFGTKKPDVAELMDAEAGKHYVPFTDPSIAQYMKIPAGKNQTLFPLVIKRNPDLKENKMYVKLMVKENENFKESYPTRQMRIVEISDMLTKPEYWNMYAEYYFCGKYGPEKLKFMINNAGNWEVNEEYFEGLFGDPSNVDMGITGHYSSYYTNKLIEYNNKLKEEGKPYPLKEADGTIVRFTLNNTEQPYI